MLDRRPRMRLYYRVMRLLSHAVFILYFRGRVYGLRNVPRTGGVVLACNHQSFFDPICATLALDREGNYMARDTLFRQPLFKRLIESLNAFPVRRGEADVAAVKELIRRLRDGRVVAVFVEATRTRDGRIGTINANALSVAKRAGAAIVPTVIDGAFEAWPRGQALPAPKPIHVTYSAPLSSAQVAALSVDDIAAHVERTLHETLDASRRRRGAPPVPRDFGTPETPEQTR